MLPRSILNRKSAFHRACASLMLLAFLMTESGVSLRSALAQETVPLPVAGTRLNLSPVFAPPLLKGIKVYRNDPFRFDFILDKGDTTETDAQLKTDSNRLIKYFLASLTIPEKDLWVNLSPYEKDRIVPDAFGQTEMGRDLLAQDYILKQITASLIYPEGEVGKAFWAKVYAEAQKRYGSTDVPVETFNKVWIIPEKATVYENKDAAFVVESKLKVMLEEDYLSLEKNTLTKEQSSPVTNKLGSDIVREVVIPLLEKEVNEGKNFAPLRQVYNALILATWYKRKVKASVLGQAYVDHQKTAGIDITDKNEKEKIWQQYVEAYKKGTYNFIKEDYDPVTQETIPRKYFSGGTDLAMNVFKVKTDAASLPPQDNSHLRSVQMRTQPFDKAMLSQKIIFPEDKEVAESFGEKPDKLIKLKAGGFKIPKFFILQSNGSGSIVLDDKLRQAFGTLAKPVIVRSAHPEEGRQHSYSGVFDSYGNISVLAESEIQREPGTEEDDWLIEPKSVETAYKEIVAGARDGYRGKKYREALGITDFNPNTMNVVIMEQVDIDIFGMFVTSDMHDSDKVLIHYQVRGQEGKGKESGGVIAFSKKNHSLEENTLEDRVRGVLIQFGETAAKIEGIYGIQQIELASSKTDGQVYVFQSRTINLGNPQDVPRLAQYKTMSKDSRLAAVGYGSFRLPVLVVESVREATEYYKWEEYRSLVQRINEARQRQDTQTKDALQAELDKIPEQAEARYLEELRTFQEQHPAYILVIKDAESIFRYKGESIFDSRKDYSFLNGLIAKAKVVIRGKNQNAIRHEDWNHVDLGGITLLPSGDEEFVDYFHHKDLEGSLGNVSKENVYSVKGNLSYQYPIRISTGNYLNILSNVDGAYIWYDENLSEKKAVAVKDRRLIDSSGKSTDGAMIALRNKEGEDFKTAMTRLEPDLRNLTVTVWSNSVKARISVFDGIQEIVNGDVFKYMSSGAQEEFHRLQSLTNEEISKDAEVNKVLATLGDLKGEPTLENLLSRFSEPRGVGLQHHIGTSLGGEVMLQGMLSKTSVKQDSRARTEELLKRNQLYIALVFTLLRRWNISPITATPNETTDLAQKGGIDLNPDNIDLKTQNNGEDIKFDIDTAMLQQVQTAPVVTPVIINILPLGSLPQFLGIKE